MSLHCTEIPQDLLILLPIPHLLLQLHPNLLLLPHPHLHRLLSPLPHLSPPLRYLRLHQGQQLHLLPQYLGLVCLGKFRWTVVWESNLPDVF